MAKDASTHMNFFSRLAHYKKDVICPTMSAEERHARYAAMADEAFDEEEAKDKKP